MKRIFIILMLLLSIFTITGCNKEETIKTYDDIDYIEKDDNTDANENIEILEYIYLEDEEISIMFSKTEDEIGNTILYLVGTTNGEEIVWEYQTPPYDVAAFEVGKYIFDANDSKKVYLLENESITLLDMSTGKVSWKNTDFEFGVNSGVSINNNLYVKHEWSNSISVIDTTNGKLTKEITIPEEYMYEAYSIVGTLNNNIIIKCIAEEEIYLSVNPNNHKVNRINLYLNN